MKCCDCNKALYLIVDDDYELFEWVYTDEHCSENYINENTKLVHEAYFIEGGGGNGGCSHYLVEGQYTQHWCRSCEKLWIICCKTPCILASVCSLTKDGWYTFEKGVFKKHALEDWPYDGLDEESNLNIESLNISDENDPKLWGVCFTGPDGGCPMGYKCKVCGEEHWFYDK